MNQKKIQNDQKDYIKTMYVINPNQTLKQVQKSREESNL